jgi:hypothetical protein
LVRGPRGKAPHEALALFEIALKRRSIQQLAYSMEMPEPQESAENKYLGHRMFFNSKINAVIEEKL